jgi:hypothetical protein
MNAPTTIQSTGHPRRDVYIPQVQTMLPGCAGEELRLRCGILLSRDYATARLRSCEGEVEPVLQHIERLATVYGFASMPDDDLKALHYQIVRLFSVASGLHRVFASREGSDARG